MLASPEPCVSVDRECIIIEKRELEEAAANLSCGKCYGKVKLCLGQHDLDSKVVIMCDNCDGKQNLKINETPLTKMMVYSNMEMGSGYEGFHKLLSNLCMKPLYERYFKYSTEVADAAKKRAESVLQLCADAVKKHYLEELKMGPDEDGVFDIRVTFDGSWQKRGHTSLLAVCAVIEAETGLVIDYVTVSKFCEKCTKKESSLKRKKINQEQYNEWLVGHRDECQRNYSGSSGGMEAAGAVVLFGRSLEKKLRYTVFISDGDSSAYDAVLKMNDGDGPYGDVKIAKGECVNHVSKRLGTALRKLRAEAVTEKKTQTGRVIRMKDMGGKGKLTDNVITKLTQYYGIAVRRNMNGTVENMRQDILSTFFHCTSTDEAPRHYLCPKTQDSWCFYQRAIANNETPPSHKTMKVSFVLNDEMRQKVYAVYKRLTSDKLLSGCLLGKTQNANEHLHSRVWRYCSKYKNANSNTLVFAVAQAVCDYNVGYGESHLGPLLGCPVSKITQKHLETRDRKREAVRARKTKQRRQELNREYSAGDF